MSGAVVLHDERGRTGTMADSGFVRHTPGAPLETRLLRVAAGISIATLVFWLAFTERDGVGLCDALFWSGAGSIGLGVLILSGAWRGNRMSNFHTLRHNGLEQAAREFQDIRRAYGDLNVLAMGGTIAAILSWTLCGPVA
jgi:hypothetical protein